jgi:hypothetical protein
MDSLLTGQQVSGWAQKVDIQQDTTTKNVAI